MKRVYRCNDHITGIFSAIHDAWLSGRDENQAGIALCGNMEQELFCEYVEVEETEKKAVAVERLIKKHLGLESYLDIYQAVLSTDPDKGNAIYGTMQEARRIPDSHKIMNHLRNRHVEKVFELSRTVGGEAHAFKGFLRFEELESGVLFSEITPKTQVLTCIADHFSDRLPLENFMIYDKTHQMFLVHQARSPWVLVLGEELNLPASRRISQAQREYARLWKSFCQTIAIEERCNKKLQKQNLPLRFQQDMVEFQQ